MSLLFAVITYFLTSQLVSKKHGIAAPNAMPIYMPICAVISFIGVIENMLIWLPMNTKSIEDNPQHKKNNITIPEYKQTCFISNGKQMINN